MPQFFTVSDPALQAMTLSDLRGEACGRYIYRYTAMNKDTLMREIVQYDVRRANQEREDEAREAVYKAREEAHRATRSLVIRQQENPDPACLEYPFSEIGSFDMTPKMIPGQPTEDIGNFPNNVEHYYWIHEGQNDEEPWFTICRLTNGVYVFYKGECDYTGFDCQGSMELYASKDPAVLIHMAMGEWDYTKYIEDTA